jgi:myo-inositol-1(or 4)-monophosphatase
MEFIRSCEEMAAYLEEEIRDLVGKPSAGEFVMMGADGTPTKVIDKVAEDLIIDYLSSRSLCDTLISEEKGIAKVGNGQGTIFLDPIDGTHNAISGIPFYSISIAYLDDGEITKAFVKDLAHDETFTAIKGQGAFLNEKPIRVSDTALLEESTLSLYGRKFNPATVLRLGQKIRRWRLLGSSALELCYVACGRLDGFVDVRGTLRVTDAVGGILICQESGGTVTDKNGELMEFPKEVTIGKCLVATNSMIHQKVVEYLQE